jgi:serine/threonine protein kinase
MTTEEHAKYIDEYSNVHVQDKILGQGGQGIVFRTSVPDIAVKLATDASGNPVNDKLFCEQNKKKLKRIQNLPIADCNIALPVALLRDYAGYVMQLLSDMQPFDDFWADGKSLRNITDEDIPVWLSQCPKDIAKNITFYRNTGGLRRRLIALQNAAVNLARLHTNGLVYGDISQNNIFISSDKNYSEVWFIDADNLRFEKESVNGVYTPKFGAPELVQGKAGASSLTDCHAFATMAFWMLSTLHPFIGKKVDGDDSDWADTEPNSDFGNLNEQAYAGFFPWIDDKNDDSNSKEGGFPRTLILTDALKRICQRTFGEARTDFWKRPTMLQWAEVLADAVDRVVKCPACQMSWYYDVQGEICPYCGHTKPSMLILESFQWNGTGQSLTKQNVFVKEIFAKEINEQQIDVPLNFFTSFKLSQHNTIGLTVNCEEKKIAVKPNGTVALSLAVPKENGGQFKNLRSNSIYKTTLAKEIWLRTDNTAIPRLIRCTIKEENNR